MNIWDTITHWADNAWHFLTGINADLASAGQSLFNFIVSVAKITDWIISNPLLSATLVMQILGALVTGNTQALSNVNARINAYVFGTQTKPTRQMIRNGLAALKAWIMAQLRALRKKMFQLFRLAKAYAWHLFDTERKARRRAFRMAEAYTRQRVRWALQTVQREAASGYITGRDAQVGIIGQLLEHIAGRNPLAREAASKIGTLVLDVIEVDDPAARLLASFLLSHLINDLGLDRPLGSFTQSILGPLMGSPKPTDLHDVIADLCARTGALEGQWAQFFTDGGSEVEQAGSLWQGLTSLATDAGLLGFAVAAAKEPEATARDLSALIRPIGTATINGIAAAIAA